MGLEVAMILAAAVSLALALAVALDLASRGGAAQRQPVLVRIRRRKN